MDSSIRIENQNVSFNFLFVSMKKVENALCAKHYHLSSTLRKNWSLRGKKNLQTVQNSFSRRIFVDFKKHRNKMQEFIKLRQMRNIFVFVGVDIKAHLNKNKWSKREEDTKIDFQSNSVNTCAIFIKSIFYCCQTCRLFIQREPQVSTKICL